MIPVHVDAALNLMWAGIGVCALALLARSEFRRRRGSRWRRAVAVAVTVLSLFPCVSASDDSFCLSLLQVNPGKPGSLGTPLPENGRETSSLHLQRLLQSLDSIRVPAVYQLAITLCFLSLVLYSTRRFAAFDLLCRGGRAPPIV